MSKKKKQENIIQNQFQVMDFTCGMCIINKKIKEYA